MAPWPLSSTSKSKELSPRIATSGYKANGALSLPTVARENRLLLGIVGQKQQPAQFDNHSTLHLIMGYYLGLFIWWILRPVFAVLWMSMCFYMYWHPERALEKFNPYDAPYGRVSIWTFRVLGAVWGTASVIGVPMLLFQSLKRFGMVSLHLSAECCAPSVSR